MRNEGDSLTPGEEAPHSSRRKCEAEAETGVLERFTQQECQSHWREQCVSQLLAGRLQPVATRYLRTQRDAGQGDVARKASWYLFTGSIRWREHSLFHLFAAFKAHFTLVQFHGAMLAAEIPAAPATHHEGHPDSILGFASITLASAAGFGHYFVSMISRMSSWDVIP